MALPVCADTHDEGSCAVGDGRIKTLDRGESDTPGIFPRRRRLLACAKFRELEQSSILTHQGDPVSDVIFPLSGVLVGYMPTPSGQVIAMQTRGRESLVFGFSAVRADPRTSSLVVEIPSRAIAAPLAGFRATLGT